MREIVALNGRRECKEKTRELDEEAVAFEGPFPPRPE
jgi:hypothetical protein